MLSARSVEQEGFGDGIRFVLQQPSANVFAQARSAGFAGCDALDASFCHMAV